MLYLIGFYALCWTEMSLDFKGLNEYLRMLLTVLYFCPKCPERAFIFRVDYETRS